MSQYFDKDFFKFALGFVSILAVSFVALLLAKSYESSSKDNETAAEIHSDITPGVTTNNP